MDNTTAKKRVGEKAAEFAEDGMTIGLGTGSTVYWTIMKIGEMTRQGMRVTGIPTSEKTARLAEKSGIPLTSFAETDRLDLVIDGADEVDPDLQLIKGGGGSLLREKIVAEAADRFIVVADESKIVPRLGRFPLPVEVVPFGWELTARRLEETGCRAVLRKSEQQETFISDNHNYILDCSFSTIANPESLHHKLKQMTGIVETGLFIDMADLVVTLEKEQIQVTESSRKP